MTDVLHDPAIFLQWDSDFFKKRIARIVTHNLNEEEAQRVDAWAVGKQIDCLYYLADGSHSNSSRTAENHGFHLVDLRVTYQVELLKNLIDRIEDFSYRLAELSDLQEIQAMAGEYHSISRFFVDSHFDPILAGKLYEKWIERDFSELNHFLWVTGEYGHITGYTSASINDDETAEIGLVGVAPEARGQGLGRKLQLAVLTELFDKGVRHVEVITQGRNIAAQNLYSNSGYHLKSIDLWYHKWYSK